MFLLFRHIGGLSHRLLLPRERGSNKALSLFFISISRLSESSTTPNSLHSSESPDLPDWIKLPSQPNSPQDDFVVPTVNNLIEIPKLPSHQRVDRHPSLKTDDTEINRICTFLKKRFTSSDEVVETLRKYSIRLSGRLIEQVLMRFNNEWVPAFGVFNLAKSQVGYVHSSDVFNLMIDVLGKAQRFDLMWELVDEMDRNGKRVSLITMSKVMRRLARAGKWADSIQLFRIIEKFGINKDISALNVLMDALVKEHSVEHAEEVFNEFYYKIPPNLHTFNILIHGWCKVKIVDNAWKTVDKMQKFGFKPDVISYTSFIEAHCRDKDFSRVEAIFDEMEKKGVPPNTVSYTILMHALGKEKKVNEAVRIYARMMEHGCVPDALCYGSLIYTLSSTGRLPDARKIFEEIRTAGFLPDVNLYNIMIAVECRNLEEEAALKLLREMEEVSCKTDLKTYAPLLKMCCRMRRLKILSFLLDHMMKNDVSIELGTYSVLVHGLCRSGMMMKSCNFFEEIVVKGFVPKDCTYNLLVGELAKKGMKVERDHVQMLMLQAKRSVPRCW